MKNSKVKILLILFLLITFVATFSNASYSDVKFSVEAEPTATISFGTDSYAERSVVSKNLTAKEITLQLKVVNNEKSYKPTGEIMLVIDNSKSMTELVNEEETRYDLVIKSAQSLIKSLLENNSNLKIGAVSFSTDVDVANEGTMSDSSLVSKLTNDSSELSTAISNIKYNGPRTDLDAGITLAKQQFSDDAENLNKYVIILSDGVPNVALGHSNNYYSDEVIEKTKQSLLSLSNTTKVITMLTGISNGSSIATGTTKTYDQIIELIFGTSTNPTIGNFYYITDDEIEQTITNTIYKDLLPVTLSFKDIKLSDCFTKEIVDNFDFSYVTKANYGTISEKIDTATNSITWLIPELKSGETAIVQYKLKLKSNYDESIVNKILDTNTNLSLTYTDYTDKQSTKTSDITPKVKLTEVLPTVLPKAGSKIFFTTVGFALFVGTIIGIRYNILKRDLK